MYRQTCLNIFEKYAKHFELSLLFNEVQSNAQIHNILYHYVLVIVKRFQTSTELEYIYANKYKNFNDFDILLIFLSNHKSKEPISIYIVSRFHIFVCDFYDSEN